ncbi:MAG: hypothetical protein A2504_08135 [Bdellovibrionales bacterium RIFOXYD12_FULL_39_22]|nr:MAG: hypothetical protein A2385_01360 [Bdellovibrionales bacterium RIFOXYB1_FULL_39_21]OFZ42905.1 MAG: hypothetical protein A2485_11010 [Bdellovibrionales bacterium RIFOXYC12_FULL_39_17]OFZ47435.1 MAG: hypothetical protein A2404_14280 [Bdellovibrionales bacterium RIFOXYC1_FULL_39_130]OFZ75523.1 MAG: hypothetical protein A2560_14430 [Bdellovibrionales bacterium RIFOXYD1_FULL_39_84]OFZ93846.1 MAG: hypothetical protein A2504_08135 [Bdellovibrionales bacterium RIFOXYD12_FULL_39_22]HLE10151.1 DU
MFRNILPKEPIFFDYFEQHIDLVITLTQEVLNMANASPSAWEQHAKKVKDLEHEMDIIAHGCIEILHKSFITPIDRSDIFTLMKRMDSIANNLNGAVARMIMYNISEIRPEVKEFARILIAAENEIKKALVAFRNKKLSANLLAACKCVHDLEHEGDDLFRNALSRLFKEDDALDVIKWKDIFERLETSIDRCAQVSQIIEGAYIESA